MGRVGWVQECSFPCGTWLGSAWMKRLQFFLCWGSRSSYRQQWQLVGRRVWSRFWRPWCIIWVPFARNQSKADTFWWDTWLPFSIHRSCMVPWNHFWPHWQSCRSCSPWSGGRYFRREDHHPKWLHTLLWLISRSVESIGSIPCFHRPKSKCSFVLLSFLRCIRRVKSVGWCCLLCTIWSTLPVCLCFGSLRSCPTLCSYQSFSRTCWMCRLSCHMLRQNQYSLPRPLISRLQTNRLHLMALG